MWKTQNSRNMLKTIQLAAFISLRVASFAAEFLPVNDALRFLRTNEGGPHFTLWLSGPDLSVLTDTLHYTLPVVSCSLVFTPRLVTCNMAHQIEEDWMQHILSSRSTGAFFIYLFLTKLWEQQISATSGQNHRLHYLKCHRILTLRTVTQQIFRSQRVVRITDIVQRWKNW